MEIDFPEIVSIRGPVGSAKSTLASTWPGNCFWFDLESGANRALDRYRVIYDDGDRHTPWNPFAEGPEVVKNAMLDGLMVSRGEKVHGKLEAWMECSKKYVGLLQSDEWHTIIVDTWKELWTICHRGYLQEIQLTDGGRKNITEIEYAIPNERMERWMGISKPMKKHLVLISHERPKRVGQMVGTEYKMVESADGAMEIDGYRHTMRKADWSLITGLENPCKVQQGGSVCNGCKGWHFTVTVEKSPAGQEIVGLMIRDPSYEKLMNVAEMIGYKGGNNG